MDLKAELGLVGEPTVVEGKRELPHRDLDHVRGAALHLSRADGDADDKEEERKTTGCSALHPSIWRVATQQSMNARTKDRGRNVNTDPGTYFDAGEEQGDAGAVTTVLTACLSA